MLRTYGDETILALSNLSGEPLAVDLELAAWAGSRPTDLFSGATCLPWALRPTALTSRATDIAGYDSKLPSPLRRSPKSSERSLTRPARVRERLLF